jgi:hydrogenase maturation protease
MQRCLVIGYGNPLRRDDGVGVEAAQTVAALDLPGVSIITRHQLVPELAAPIAEADAVLFVDADVNAANADGMQLRPIEAARSVQILAHATDPSSLLGLSSQLFGGNTRAWMLGIPVEDLGVGFGLSPRSRDGLRVAVRLIEQWAAGLTKTA